MYSEFIKKAVKQDDRNVFEPYHGKITGVPKQLESFYSDSNPVDVEVSIQGAYVKFIPYKDLVTVQKEYDLDVDCFVFATCNGDPVYYKKDGIYSCVYGKTGIIEDKIASSITQYMELLD